MNIDKNSSLYRQFIECEFMVNETPSKINLNDNIKLKLKIISNSIKNVSDKIEKIPDEFKNLQNLDQEVAMKLYIDTVTVCYSSKNNTGNIKEGHLQVKGNTFRY